MKITVHVKPNARVEEIRQTSNAEFSVSVKEPPVGGKSNEAVERVLAVYFDIARSRIRIVSGKTSKNKIVEII